MVVGNHTPRDKRLAILSRYTLCCICSHIALVDLTGLYTDPGVPFTPNPVTLKTDPASGYFAFSSGFVPWAEEVTNNSSKFGPPKQHEVILGTGRFTLCSTVPVQYKNYTTHFIYRGHTRILYHADEVEVRYYECKFTKELICYHHFEKKCSDVDGTTNQNEEDIIILYWYFIGEVKHIGTYRHSVKQWCSYDLPLFNC